MTLQFSTAVRNAMLDAFETTIGVSAVLLIRSGAPPATPATADSGTVLATYALASDWMNAASAGSKSFVTNPTDSADAAGTAGHFRLYANGGVTCHIQGTITLTAGGGDMTVDNTSITAAQAVSIVSFTLTAPGA